jgi:hypothetical protein
MLVNGALVGAVLLATIPPFTARIQTDDLPSPSVSVSGVIIFLRPVFEGVDGKANQSEDQNTSFSQTLPPVDFIGFWVYPPVILLEK